MAKKCSEKGDGPLVKGVPIAGKHWSKYRARAMAAKTLKGKK
jgi:hypothetical protein